MKRALLALAILVGSIGVLVFVLLHSLDQPWLKRRVRALVHTEVGVDIDYQSVRVRLLDGLEIDGLVLSSPSGLRSIAPELARMGHVEAAWSSAFFTGAGRRVDRLTISDVAITVVLDEHGNTSFDALGPPSPSPPPPPKAKTPLSHQLQILDALAPALPALDVTGIALDLVRTEHGVAVERVVLHGLRLHAEPVHDGEWHLKANLGAAPAPLELDVARAEGDTWAGDAHLRTWLTADATPSQVIAVMDVEVPKQSFVQGLGATHLLHAEARARFDPAAGKTEIAISHTSLADDVATAEAAIELPDSGAPRVNHAEGDVDFVRLVAAIPPALLPVRAQLARGQAHYRIDGLDPGNLPRLNDGAKLAVEADFAGVKLARAGGYPDILDAGTAKLSAHVVPGADASIQAHASLALDGVDVAGAAAAKGLTFDLDATQAKDGALTGQASLAFSTLETAPTIAARDGKLGLRFDKLFVDPKAPLTARGDIALTADIGSLDVRASSMRTALDGLAVRARSSLAGHTPYALEGDVRAAQLQYFDGQGHALAHTPVHVIAKVGDAVPDVEKPMASRGVAHVVADAGDLHAQIDATKAPDALDFSLEIHAPALSPARPLLSPEIAKKIALDRMATSLTSRGRVERITSATPAIEQHTEIALDHPGFDRITARALKLALDSKGTALHHALDADLRFDHLALDGANAGDDRITLGAELDREAPSLHLHLATEGRAQAKMKAAFAFDRGRRAVTYDVEGGVERMASLAPLASAVPALKGVDLSKLEIALAARGALTGVVSDMTRDGVVRLEPAPQQTAGIDGTIELRGKKVAWGGADLAFSTPEIALSAKLHTQGARRTADATVQADALHVASGLHDFDVAGLHDAISASLDGNLAAPDLEMTHQLALRALEQDVAPTYPIGNATLAVTLRRSRDGVLRIPSLELANGAGGTKLSLRGAFDPSENQRRLAARGTLHQDLARVSNAPRILAARGTADVDFRVESPNLSLFRLVSDVKFAGADVQVPRSGIVVEGADGEVPITVAVRTSEHGVRLLRDDQDNPYSSLRFSDQHPLLSRSSFISVRRLSTPLVSISSLVGNLQIQQNIISLRQFEMGIRDGRVTGLCALDWNGEESTFSMHVRADGVKSSSGEPFTGNAAVEISAAEHSIEGRADILKIGKRHFNDLLDMQDPFHVDPAFNRVRSALRFGYPDRLRVDFNHGFASAHVDLGGIASIVHIGDIRGIPMGPIIDKYLNPFFPSKK